MRNYHNLSIFPQECNPKMIIESTHPTACQYLEDFNQPICMKTSAVKILELLNVELNYGGWTQK